MLEVFINYICAFSLAIFGFELIKRVINSKEKLMYKNMLLLTIGSIFVVISHYIEYNIFTALINFSINILTYKIIFKIKFSESLVLTGILMLTIFIAELLWMPIFINIITVQDIRNNIYTYLITNFLILILAFIMTKIKKVLKLITSVYKTLIKNEDKLNILVILALFICISSLIFNISINFKKNIVFLSNFLIICTAISIVLVYANNKEKYNKLMNEYDSIFTYVQHFEEWIEREQFIRHEYKNQLAVIYDLTSEKCVKDKVNEILNNTINIEDNQIQALKVLPKGGLKGLMYYKTSIAQKNKIETTIDVSISDNGIFSKLNKNKINELSKIIGIYYDNAIDAAKESKKKHILIEIYELSDKANIVISNTFNKKSIIKNMDKKGVSTKGKGRGNGLFYAKKIVSKNEWIKTKQEIVDKYYIETITILKNTSKK